MVQAFCQRSGIQFKLAEFNLYDYMPNWVQPLVGSPEERAAKLRDPAVREAMKRDVHEWPDGRTDWSYTRVLQAAHERNHKYEGLTLQQLAEMTGKEPLDAYLESALDEGLETEFEMLRGDSPEQMKRQEANITSPYSHVSASDGGAHTRFSTNATWPMWWLSFWIRGRGIMTLEQAHYKISAYPAWFADFRDRGTLRVGSWADIVGYYQEELGFVYDAPVFTHDFPGGEHRLIQKPTRLRYTIVNGTVTFEGNECTGALPGKLLRSYDMVA